MKEVIYHGSFIIGVFCAIYIFFLSIYIKDLKRSIPAILLIIISIITFSSFSYNLISKIIRIVLCLFVISNSIIRYKDNMVIKAVKGNINYYNQRDIRWGLRRFTDSIFSFRGCGPSVIAMIASLKTPNTTPIDIKLWLYTSAPSFLGKKRGTKIDAVAEFCWQHDIPWKALGKNDKQIMIEGLYNGAMFAISFKKHMVLAANVNSKYIIIDPALVNRIIFTNCTKFINKVFNKNDFKKTPYPIIGVYI